MVTKVAIFTCMQRVIASSNKLQTEQLSNIEKNIDL